MAHAIAVRCPNCGASLSVEPSAESATCSYCGTRSVIVRKGAPPQPPHVSVIVVRSGAPVAAGEPQGRRAARQHRPMISVDELDASLRAVGRPERAEHEKAYLRSELTHLGVSIPALRKIARGARRASPEMSRRELWAVLDALWSEPVHERRMLAVELADAYGALLEPRDVPRLLKMLRESRTWALVDPLAIAVVGGLVERFPELTATLDRWADDDDFWVRRAAMLALLRPLRAGGGDFARFARYADAMLEEKEFFVRKAIGWVLREVSKKRPGLVADWLEPRAARASGVTVREAVKYLPAARREAILERR